MCIRYNLPTSHPINGSVFFQVKTTFTTMTGETWRVPVSHVTQRAEITVGAHDQSYSHR